MARHCFHAFSGLALLPVIAASYQTPPLETITVASQQYLIDPAGIVLAGTTVSAGGPAVTIGGVVVSEDSDEDVFVDGVEVLTGLIDTATTTLSSLSQSQPQSLSTSATTSPSLVPTATPLNNFLAQTSWSSAFVLDSQTTSGGSMVSYMFSSAGPSTTTPSSDINIGMPESSPSVTSTTIGNFTVSKSTTQIDSGSVGSLSASTTTTFSQSAATTDTISQSDSGSFDFSSSSSVATTVVTRKSTSGSISNLYWSNTSSSLASSSILTSSDSKTSQISIFNLSSSNSVANSGAPPSQTVTTGAFSSTSEASLTETSLSTTYTSVSTTSAPSNQLTATTTNSNVTSLEIKHTLISSVSSSASITTTSSNSLLISSISSMILSSHWSTASSTIFPTSTNPGTDTVTTNTPIIIPTTPLSPTDAAAIAGGAAIGGGLALLYGKARKITDESTFLASKAEFLGSIENFKSDLETLHLDLGGGGISAPCSKRKSRFRFKRSILSSILNTITSTVCSLTKVQVDIIAVPPDLDEIAVGWEEVAGLAAALTEEEKEEEKEEEEEEEKESQSAEEEKASQTAKSEAPSSSSAPKTSSMPPSTSARSSVSSVSSVSSNSVSSAPAAYFNGLIQGYPVKYYEPDAAEEAIFAVAGAALFAVMGGSDDSPVQMSGISTSSFNSVSTTGRLTASISSNTSFLPQTTGTYTSSGLWSPGNGGKNGVTTSTVDVATSTTELSNISASPASSSDLALNSLSISTMTASSTDPKAPDKAMPGITSSDSAYTNFPAQTPTSLITTKLELISEASISSVSAASASAASISAASASSASAASVSAASAAAVYFPSQISSNKDSSPLCKSISGNTCKIAYSNYNPSYLYTAYSSYVHTDGGSNGAWLGWGCAAMLKCDTAEAYAKGMPGQQILNAFDFLFAKDGVAICGTIYMDNGCYLKVDACASCQSSIPCDALPEVYQPPKGGVPCYYKDGTTWPPAYESPVRGKGIE